MMRYILLLVLTLSGCGASIRAVKTQTEDIHVQAAEVHTETSATASAASHAATELRKDEEIITEVLEFDTTQPADPATGTPPLRRRTVQTRRAATQARQVATTSCREVAVETTAATAIEKSETKAATDERSRRGMNWMQRIACTLGVISLLALFASVALRRFKR